jgi:hypothetical protein
MKVERVTVTFHPRGEPRGMMRVPSTYDASQHAYGWKHASEFEYMIVPTRVSGREVQVDFFINVQRLPRPQLHGLPRLLRSFLEARAETEWKGLEIHAIGRPAFAVPPRERMVRGSIEDILGIGVER